MPQYEVRRTSDKSGTVSGATVERPNDQQSRLATGGKRRGIQLLVKIRDTLFSDGKEPFVDLLQEPIPHQLTASCSRPLSPDIDSGNLATSRERQRSHITLFPDNLKNPVIGGVGHPLGVFSHLITRWVGRAHSNTDILDETPVRVYHFPNGFSE